MSPETGTCFIQSLPPLNSSFTVLYTQQQQQQSFLSKKENDVQNFFNMKFLSFLFLTNFKMNEKWEASNISFFNKQFCHRQMRWALVSFRNVVRGLFIYLFLELSLNFIVTSSVFPCELNVFVGTYVYVYIYFFRWLTGRIS